LTPRSFSDKTKETRMPYTVNGTEMETDDQGYLLEPEYGDEVVSVIAEAEGITLTDAHWTVVNYLRDEYREHGHTPNFRNMLKGLAERLPGCDSKALYDLFPTGPAKQGAKVAGLPQPLGKGGD
jgi:tRNA 2-thiouridine synthesizing protein E